MAKFRMVNTRFWDDSYITGLSPAEKLLFLYLLTNPLTNISGVYEVGVKRIAFDTGLSLAEVKSTLQKFDDDKKIARNGSWIGIVNFVKHQSMNPKVMKGIALSLDEAPREVVEQVKIPVRLRAGIVVRDRTPSTGGSAKHISELISSV